MTFHEKPSILNSKGNPVAKIHHDLSIKSQLSSTLRAPLSSPSELFFKDVQSLYKKYHIDLTLQRTNSSLSSTDGEFIPRESIIKIRPDSKDYDLHLAHETAHALEHIYGKIGKLDAHFYGGTSTGMGMFLKTVSPSILEEVIRCVSIPSTDKSFQTYANDFSELFARFVAEMVVHPLRTVQISPKAFDLFSEKFPIKKYTMLTNSYKPLNLYHGSTKSGLTKLEEGSGGEYQKVAGIYFTRSSSEAEKYTKINGKKHPENVYMASVEIKNPAPRSVIDEIGFRNPDGSFMNGLDRRKELIKRGYDGVDDEMMGEVIVFYPEQVKSLIQRKDV